MIEDLMVYENIFLGRERKKSGKILNKAEMIAETQRLMTSIGIDINPKAYIRDLNNGEKQMVEIVRAVSQNSEMVIMDEPTSSLSEHEVKALFDVIRKLKEDNVAVIYISHRLKEIMEIGDTLSVLRDGVLVKTLSVAEVTENQMVAMMVGREMKQYYYKAKGCKKDEIVLEASHLTKAGEFEDVSFQLYRGEILGVAGLIGAGRTEVMRAIFGAEKPDSLENAGCLEKSIMRKVQRMLSKEEWD